MKVVFFGTSDVGIPVLEALIKEHEVVAIVTSPDALFGRKQELQATPIANLAAQLNIPVHKPVKVKDNPEFLELLKTFQADIFIVVSYGKILPAALLEIPPLKTINVHFSLLPKYRGAAPIQYALLNGETATGTTIFILDELVDHGPVLIQKDLYIDPTDTFPTLAKKLADLSAETLINLLPQYEAGVINPQEQNHDSATFTKMIKKEHGHIDWTKPSEEIINMWRAFTPWPGIWTEWQGQNLKVLKAEALKYSEENIQKELIPCGNNTFLHLQEVQLAGKNPVSFKDFLNGHKDFKPKDLFPHLEE